MLIIGLSIKFREIKSNLILISKKSYYNDYSIVNKNNIKETWKGIKQLITLKSTKKFYAYNS